MIVFKMFINFEEEEKYLHEMALKGFILNKHSEYGYYKFSTGEKQDLNYKVDYRAFKTKIEFNNYITLFEDAGWKHVSGNKGSGNQYFLPVNISHDATLFSDKDSADERYKKLYNSSAFYSLLMIALVTGLLLNIDFDLSRLGFLTQGLFERTGQEFWLGFFFELPFVLLRTLPLLWLAVYSVYFAYLGTKVKKMYQLTSEVENEE
ncbi:DUF2812 domain-containing protein [Anaerorhabdus sp.]|uniref:DUF2812 domain-containing protein n=1 Tax=Anaerorhabdus sp. TaxID=1872524 RepID=UPI002FC96A7D